MTLVFGMKPYLDPTRRYMKKTNLTKQQELLWQFQASWEGDFW
jgi:hypothetical protein